MAIKTEYIKLKKAAELYKDIVDEDDILLLAIENKISLYHWPGHWYKVPLGPLHELLEGAETVTTPFYTQIDGEWKITELKEVDPNNKVIKTTKNREWNRNILYVNRQDFNKIVAKNTQELSLTELLEQLTPDQYPEGMTPGERGSLTNRIKTLKNQLPAAFTLCFNLLFLELDSSKVDELSFTEKYIKNIAKEKGIGPAMAKDIHGALPRALKGQKGRKSSKTGLS